MFRPEQSACCLRMPWLRLRSEDASQQFEAAGLDCGSCEALPGMRSGRPGRRSVHRTAPREDRRRPKIWDRHPLSFHQDLFPAGRPRLGPDAGERYSHSANRDRGQVGQGSVRLFRNTTSVARAAQRDRSGPRRTSCVPAAMLSSPPAVISKDPITPPPPSPLERLMGG